MSDSDVRHESEGYRFGECPDCGGELQYQTQADTMCLDCEEVFCHEIRSGGRNLLWSLDDKHHLDEVTARAE